MKKTILFIAVLLIISVSCSKDDPVAENDLTGTTWIYTASADGTNVKETIKFTGKNSFTDHAVYTGDSNLDLTIVGSYTFNPPIIKLVMNNTEQSGTITNNSMSITTTFGNVATYIKQ